MTDTPSKRIGEVRRREGWTYPARIEPPITITGRGRKFILRDGEFVNIPSL